MSDVTLWEAAAQYVDTLKGASRQPALIEVNRFVEWQGRAHLVRQLRGHDIELYAERMGPSNPNSTRRAEQLRAFLLYMKKKDFTETNLAPHLRLRKGGPRAAATARGDVTEVQLTSEGIEALKAELQSLVSQRADVREEIRTAMLDKDFRENAPLDAAKDKQGHIEARIREIEAMLKRAVVVEQSGQGDRVQVGVTVHVRNLRSGALNRFTIVGPTESNAADGRISSASPVGRSLIDHSVGDEVEVSAPAGTMRLRVERIGD
jgi:transcription elongation factor GreA